MLLSGTISSGAITTIRRTPSAIPICTASDSLTNSSIIGDLLTSSIHAPFRPVAAIRNLQCSTVAPINSSSIPGSAYHLISGGTAQSAFRPIIPSTSAADSFVLTTLNSLISSAEYDGPSNQQHSGTISATPLNSDCGGLINFFCLWCC